MSQETPGTLDGFFKQLDKFGREKTAEGVREQQVYAQGYAQALYESRLVGDLDASYCLRAIRQRVDERLTELERQAGEDLPRYCNESN